jgi:hypothetical protein
MIDGFASPKGGDDLEGFPQASNPVGGFGWFHAKRQEFIGD